MSLVRTVRVPFLRLIFYQSAVAVWSFVTLSPGLHMLMICMDSPSLLHNLARHPLDPRACVLQIHVELHWAVADADRLSSLRTQGSGAFSRFPTFDAEHEVVHQS